MRFLNVSKIASATKNAGMCEICSFVQIDDIADKIVAEKVDWVIIAGGDGTIRALIEKLSNRGHVPYISVFLQVQLTWLPKSLW